MIQSQENTDRVESINKRIYSRNVPGEKLGAQYDPRPSSTRFNVFPDIDNKMLKETYTANSPRNYTFNSSFNPGHKGPFIGYSNKVNNENQLFRINHYNNNDCINHFPNNWNSDMYIYKINGRDLQDELNLNNKHSLLFQKDNFNPTNLNPDNLGRNFFSNNTRVERRGIE